MPRPARPCRSSKDDDGISESYLKDRIIAALRRAGIFAWRSGAGPYAPAGVSDISGVLPGGRALYIEAKKPGKYADPRRGLTKPQAIFLHQAREQGALCIVTDTVVWVLAVLREEGYGQ